MEFELTDDKKAYKLIKGEDTTKVIIPGVYNGLPVTIIGREAFANCGNPVSVTIPESVMRIEYSAFKSCRSLKTVVIPDSITKYGDSVFADCTALTGISLSKNAGGIENGMFQNCSSLAAITIPDSVTFIGGAFSGCTALKHITIPAGVNLLGSNIEMFSNSGMKSITVAQGNAKFKDEGNCLLDIDGQFLFFGCKSSVIPEGVTKICRAAFYNCTELADIIIPESVTTIGPYAFYGCAGITSLTIPDTVEYIDDEVFSGWKKTQTIFANEQKSHKWSKKWGKCCNANIVYKYKDLIQQLSKREQKVIESILAGCITYKEIGAALKISHQTVKVHLRNIYKTIGVSSIETLNVLFKGYSPENR